MLNVTAYPPSPVVVGLGKPAPSKNFSAHSGQKQPDNFDEIFHAKAELAKVCRIDVDQNITNNSPPSIL